jgi:hypothetical protein
MKILLSAFFYKEAGFKLFYNHFYNWLINYFPKEKTEVKFLMLEKCYREFQDSKEYTLTNTTPILVKTQDLSEIFNRDLSTVEFCNKINKKEFSKDEKEKFKKFVKEKLDFWEPEIAITQGCFSSFGIFKDVFPDALCLTTENGMFARKPFFRSLTYDPFNSVLTGFTTNYASEIKSFKISKQENKKVEKFKKKLTKLIDKSIPIKKEIMKYKKQFKKTILLPLIGDFSMKLLEDTKYNNEKELIDDVMQNTPSDIGVFVTQHDNTYSLFEKDINYFSNKYKNFIFLKSTDKRCGFSNSLYYFKYVDMVFNTTSKTALLGMLWDKPVLSLAKTTNELIKDGQGIEELNKVLNTPYKNKNNIIYWYFTHDNYMYEYFCQKLDYYKKNGIDFNYFNKINDFDEISKKIINHIKYDKLKQKIKRFLIVIDIERHCWI